MEREREAVTIGLCATCRFAKRVESGKGSVFFLCRRSESDSTYPRYPPLPMRFCPGYEKLDRRPDGVG
jgi:hypothetical protein